VGDYRLVDYMTQISEGDEFKVESDWRPIAASGVYIKVTAIEPDDIIVFKSTGVGSDEVDVPKERVEQALADGTLVRREHDSQMHD